MTVSTTTSRVDYTGNGSTVLFAVPFPFIDKDYLTVLRIDSATQVATTLILDSGGALGYTVAGAGDATGSVTLVTAPTAAQRLAIIREVPSIQDADFVANDPFPAETFEDALDRLTMIAQQNRESIDRAVTLPITVSSVSGELAIPQASALIGWNASATELVNYTASELITADLIAGNYIVNTFTGNGVLTSFLLSAAPGVENNTQVYIDGVYQEKSAYSVTGSSLDFPAPPTLGASIEVVQAGAVTINTPASGSVTFSTISATGTGMFLRQTSSAMEWTNEFNQNLLGANGKRVNFQIDVSTLIADGVLLPSGTIINLAANFNNDSLDGFDTTGSWWTTPVVFAWWYKSGTQLRQNMTLTTSYTANSAVLAVDGNITATRRATVGSLAEVRQTVAAAASTTLNLSLGHVIVLTQDVNITTLAFSNVPSTGNTATVTIKRVKDNTGTARTIAWPASVKWPGGVAPTLSATANAVDIITLLTEDGGTTYYGSSALAFA
jgi:hypothetical protein